MRASKEKVYHLISGLFDTAVLALAVISCAPPASAKIPTHKIEPTPSSTATVIPTETATPTIPASIQIEPPRIVATTKPSCNLLIEGGPILGKEHFKKPQTKSRYRVLVTGASTITKLQTLQENKIINLGNEQIEVIVAGYSGAKTHEIFAHTDSALASKDIDVLVTMAGQNNLNLGDKVPDIVAEVEAEQTTIATKHPKTSAILISPNPIQTGEQGKDRVAVAALLAKGHTVINTHNLFINPNPCTVNQNLFADSWHPNSDGLTRIADTINTSLQTLLGK